MTVGESSFRLESCWSETVRHMVSVEGMGLGGDMFLFSKLIGKSTPTEHCQLCEVCDADAPVS